MKENIQCGGLILESKGTLFLTDIRHYSGTYLLHEHPSPDWLAAQPRLSIQATRTVQATKVDGLFWFMNSDSHYLYFSDQKRRHALCRMGQGRQEIEVLLDQPCYQVQLLGEWLYYINEDDRRLYRCSSDGKHEEKLVNDKVTAFSLEAEEILYASAQGIFRMDLTGSSRACLDTALTSTLLRIGRKIAFTDSKQRYTLTLYNETTQKIDRLDDLEVASMTTDGRYLYCTNRANGNSIYRVDPDSGQYIRIYGESADFLHVIGHELFFTNHHHDWHTISLTGGDAIQILP